MNCGEIRDTLLLLPAGEPAGDGVREHLGDCADCARTAELARLAWDFAAPGPDEPVPVAAAKGLRLRIGRSRRRPVLMLRIATAAAALLVASLWFGRGRPVEEPVQLCDGPISGYLEPAFGALEVQEGPEPGPLGLKSHSVSVTLDDWVMRTEVEEIFVNTTGQRLEGTFVFPLPPDASLSRFAMEVEGTLVEGELVERVRAREVYEGIVRQMKDPALLEWMPGNVFKARVFPIEPYSEKRVILAYTQAPRMWNGAVGYVYPLVSEKTQAHPPEEITIRAAWKFGKPVKRIDCPTHRADVQRRDDRSGRAELLLKGVRPMQDFQLRLEIDPDELAVSGHRPEGEDGFVGIAFAPRIEGAARPAGTTVFVVDRSMKMSEKELEIARRVVDRMIAHLPAEERVGIVAHHVECETRAPETSTADRRREWRDFLWSLKGEGASDVLGALRRAVELGGAAATIVYVGKGVPTWGETDPSKADLGGRPFRAILVGSGTGEGTLAALGGEIRRIVAGGDTGAEIEAAARTAGLEPLRGLEVEIGSARRALPPMYPGERVFVFERYAKPGATRVTVRGKGIERAVEAELPAGPTAHRPLMRLWAQGALEERVAACRRAGEPREAVDPIVAMSRKFQVMTPYTSFLVLESEKAYEQYKIERAKRLDEGESDGKSSRKAADRAEIESARRHREGEKLLASGQYGEAVRVLELAEAGASKDLLPRLRESLGHARMAARSVRQVSEWDDLLAKLKSNYEVSEQLKQTRADEHYRLAERYFQADDFEKAQLECEKALALNGRHAPATALRLEIDFTLGRPSPRAGEYDQYMSHAIVRHQQTLIEIDSAIERGRRMEGRGEREAAEREYRKVVEFAKWMPTGVELETRRRQAVELLNGRTEGERERIRASQEQYHRALQFHQRGDFERAKVEAAKAIDAWPENVAARKLNTDISQILVGGRAEFGARNIAEDARSELRVKVEQGQIEITKHVRDGERFLQARMYEEAMREFESAQFKIRNIPYDVKAMNDLLPHLDNSLVWTKNARILDQKRVEDEKKHSLEAEAGGHDTPTKREVVRKMAHLLELSYMAFDQRRYDRAIKLADEILLIDPHYPVAKELKEDVQKTRHKEEYHSILSRKVEQWKRLTDDDEQAVIPYSQTVRFPSRDEWSMVNRRLTEAIIKTEGSIAGDEDLDILAINRKLDTMKVDLAFENTKLEDILAFVRDFSGLNLVLDAAVRDKIDPEKPMTFKVKDLVLKNTLKLLLSQHRLDYRVTDDRVVLLTDPKKAAGGAPGEWGEARRSLDEATRTFNLGDYDRAERRLLQVLEFAASPAAGAGSEPDRRRAQEMLERTRQSRQEKKIEEEKALSRLLADERARDDLKRRFDQKRELELLFGQAQLHFGQEQYPRAVDLCEKILKINPNLTSVAEMRNVAQRLNHMKGGSGSLKPYLEDWKRTFEQVELNGAVQRADELEFPSREVWLERGSNSRPDAPPRIATAAVKLDALSKRKPKGIAQLEEDVQPEDKEIQDKLRSMRITIDMQNAPLTAVVDYVREISGLNIHIQGIDNPDQEVMSVKANDMVLDGALRVFLAPRGQAFEVRDGVVIVTTAEAIRRRIKLELYDVQDITYGMQDFPGVDISLARARVAATMRPRAETAGRELPPKAVLARFKVDLAARATPSEVIQLLADRSGLTFAIDDDAKAKLEKAPAAERAFRDAILEEALKQLLEPLALEHSLSTDGVVIVRARAVQWTGEDLAARVKAAVFPDSWSEADGKSIQFQNGLLIVRNTVEVHAGVRKFLADLRK